MKVPIKDSAGLRQFCVRLFLQTAVVALGAKKYISIGTAGSLQSNIEVGDLVVCDRAIRDEGVSHHYRASSKYAYP